MERFNFPKGFLWGASTSAYQVEGGIRNDWSETGEKFNAGKACDHYNRYEEDFNIAKSLNNNAHRFSIEWSRVEPEEGKFDEKEIEHYRKVIQALRARGIEPFVTLWHYTLPVWFLKRGGWLARDAKDVFLRFALRMVKEYKNEVQYWCLYNEPETYARHGYLQGNRPPGIKNIFRFYRVLRKLTSIYIECYKRIKVEASFLQVGFSETNVYFDLYNRLPHNLFFMKFIKWWRNNPFLSLYIAHSDFIGLQYYFHSRIRFNLWKSKWGFQYNENKETSDIGWEIYPEGIYYVLKELSQWKKPIYIMENGVADAKDIHREKFIKDHLFWIHKAIREEVDVRGYFYWSLLDNFEWDKGFWPRFGLVEMDYQTMERKIRPSAKVYAEICKNNGFEIK